MKIRVFSKFKRNSKLDAVVWAVTWTTTVVVAIDIGLLAGIILSLISLIYTSLKPNVCILGRVPFTDIFLDSEKFEKVIEIPQKKIFHYGGSINFATKASFKSLLCEKLNINLTKELKNIHKEGNKLKAAANCSNLELNHLVIDFSALTS